MDFGAQKRDMGYGGFGNLLWTNGNFLRLSLRIWMPLQHPPPGETHGTFWDLLQAAGDKCFHCCTLPSWALT